MEEIKKSKKGKIAAGIAAGVLAAALVAAFLSSKEGKKFKKNLGKQFESFKKDVEKKLAEIEVLTKEKYQRVIDEVSGFYKRVKKVKEEDLKEIVADIKARWPKIEKRLKATKEKSKKKA